MWTWTQSATFQKRWDPAGEGILGISTTSALNSANSSTTVDAMVTRIISCPSKSATASVIVSTSKH